jgi:hypothetical protein
LRGSGRLWRAGKFAELLLLIILSYSNPEPSLPFSICKVCLGLSPVSNIPKIDRPDVACVALLGYNHLLMPNQLSRIQEELEKTVLALKVATDSDERKTLFRKMRRLLDEAAHISAEP